MVENGHENGRLSERGDLSVQQAGLSLEEIENDRWGDAPPGATRLVAAVHALRRAPVRTLSAEDLRLLIGQQVGLQVLLPDALARLERNPLVEADLYPGDLLSAALRLPTSFWATHEAQRAQMRSVVEQAVAALGEPTDPVDTELLTRARAFLAAP